MVELDDRKIWIDGCFDFAHHGHAGAMMQARQHGDELYVGVHNDEDILLNKGPPVMKLDERMAAVEGCRWCSVSIANAPYVTDYKVMDKYGCKYVVHGDDITTDKDGKDCYAEVKEMGRFIVVKRTPNISTTDLVGRMLLFSKDHHMFRIDEEQWNKKSSIGLDDKKYILTGSNIERYRQYATGPDAKSLGAKVMVNTGENIYELIKGCKENEGKDIIYVSGGFDLFNPGHITLLKEVRELATKQGCIVYVGLSDDLTVNQVKGSNYPIMSLFERSLCVLQSKYIDGIILNAPNATDDEYLRKIGNVVGIAHGPTKITKEEFANVKDVKIVSIPASKYASMNVASIVDRVLANREAFEERQRRKGWKREIEEGLEKEERGE